MAFDGIYLHSLIETLKETLIDSKIDKINQPEKDEIILTIRKDRKNLKLLISSSSKYPRIHFTKINKDNPLQPPMFTMVLRKYLVGGKIVDIKQIDGDRLLNIYIEASDEMGFNSVYILVIEIMGRHSNISLIRERDFKIMESIKHIGADVNSYRILYPGIKYIYPPKSQKINPFNFSFEEINNFINEDKFKFAEEFFSTAFTGISKLLSKELFILYNKNFSEVTASNIKMFLETFLEKLNANPSYKIYLENNHYFDLSVLNMTSLEESHNYLSFEDINEMMDIYYIEKDKQERLKARSTNIHRLLSTNIDRCLKKSEKLNSLLEKCDSKDNFKIKGDLLTSYIYNIKKGDSTLTVENFYSENLEEITIDIDVNKSPSENVQSYYKKYNKLKKSEENALEQLEKNEEELQYLYSVITNIENCESYIEIEDIKNELISTGYLRKRKSSKLDKKAKTSKPLHFISSDGIDIYVGKNNLQNDYLSLKFANKNFMWLHTKTIPGSHVIVCSNDVPDNTLTEAATLAAYYSKAQDSSKVSVDYTLVKNLKKPNGSKPGMVIYHTNYTMLAEPSKFKELNIEKK